MNFKILLSVALLMAMHAMAWPKFNHEKDNQNSHEINKRPEDYRSKSTDEHLQHLDGHERNAQANKIEVPHRPQVLRPQKDSLSGPAGRITFPADNSLETEQEVPSSTRGTPISTESRFGVLEPAPICQEGYVLVGQRCRKMA